MNKKPSIGNIIDTFTIENRDRILVLDRDCSKDVKYGGNIEIVASTGETVTTKLLDGFIDDGSKYGSEMPAKISSLRVENASFPDGVDFKGSKLCVI